MTYDSIKENDIGARITNYYPTLKRNLGKILGTTDVVDDVAQEACTRALKGIQARGPPEKLEAWLMGIGYNIAKDYLHQRSFNKTTSIYELEYLPTSKDLDPLDAAYLRDRVLAVREVVDQLKPRERLVLQESIYNRKRFEDIAPEVGRSESATKAIHYRAKKKLKRMLEERFGENGENL